MPERTPRREIEDDHDLLTFGEAGARLHREITAERAVIGSLQDEDPTLAAAQRRLQLLEDAAERNFRGRITDENFERFFGYRGTARRTS